MLEEGSKAVISFKAQNLDAFRLKIHEVHLWLNKIPGSIYFRQPVERIEKELTDIEARDFLKRIINKKAKENLIQQ